MPDDLRLKFYDAKNIVVDSVMVATSGSALIKTDAVKTLIDVLLPIATLVTPNIPEAQILAECSIKNKEDMQRAAKSIGDTYGTAVLLKGGHNINDANDLLYADGEMVWFEGKRIDKPNTHGTGCTLSAAFAAALARKEELTMAAKSAKSFIEQAIISGAEYEIGNGHGPVNHNFNPLRMLSNEIR